MSDDSPPSPGPLRRFLTAKSGPLMFVREVLSSALAVVLVGMLLFAVSGVWPPMVAVESGSMQPHMQKGDLVFITQPDRFSPEYAYDETGVVPYDIAAEHNYTTFGSYGSVVVYMPPDRVGAPIIHRARLHVDRGENWYDRANPAYLAGDSCAEIAYCPAPHAGFITKGDHNDMYDQANGLAPPVKTEWIRGVARVRIPYLGWVRLLFSGAASTPTIPTGVAPSVPVDVAAGATAGPVSTESANATVSPGTSSGGKATAIAG
ncbi:S26 family signal peptidase [Halobaculum sp. D14]|uniref:S26 family signal peptidase n=1 Tax=Halobaculum sp. D14 TaxID=3421642 RepID=UPI003EBBB7CD